MALAVATSSALAQFPVRVRVLDQETQRPLGGALVSAVGGPAATLAVQAVLATGDGTALLRVPAIGVYRILVRRIGYAPFTSDTVRVTGTTSVAITIEVPATRIALATVRVTARRECDAEALSTSSEAAPIWEEVRKALETSFLSRGTSFIVTTGVSTRRTFGEDGKLLTEDTTAKGTAGARPFAAVDPGLLERGGYVQGGYRTSMTFNAPDELVLLSDGFRRMHCLSMASAVRRSGDTTLIGLAFEPRTNNQLADIQGTLWVDSATSELRRLEYTYVRAPLPITVSGLGGFVDFARHRSGAWYVSAWSIRMPRWRPTNMDKSGVALGGFSEVGGAVLVLRESTALPATIVRTVTGSVFDSLGGRDMPGAVVRIPALGRETTTDFLGRFRFDSVTAGIWDVVAEYPPLASTGLVQVQGLADVVEVSRTEVALAVPSLATLWKRSCPLQRVPEGSGGLVSGTVRDARPTPIANAAVEFIWKQPPRDSTIHTRVFADSAGRYVACVGSGVGVTVRALRDSLGSVPVTFAFVPARVATRDVMIASDEEADAVRVDSTRIVDALGRDAGAVVDGSVRDPGGRGIVTARVRLLDVAGEARVTGRNGEFAWRGVPAGQHVVSIEAIGYERARRVVLVGDGDSAHVDVRLARLATLSAVTIEERARVNALRVDIASRVVAGHGYIMDSLKLARVAHVYQAFNVPATRVRIQGSRFVVDVQQLGFQISKTNPDSWCVPAVYIDDIALGFDQLSDLPKENIALIEYYNRVANAPLKYTGTGTLGSHSTTSSSAASARGGVVQSACGVVLVWTKAFLRVADLVGKPNPRKP
jgi:hypothetical protein